MATYIDERGDAVKSENTNRKVEASAVEARQGLLGRPVLYVLIGGLFLAMIAWGAAEIFGEAVDNDPATEVTQPAPAADNRTSATPESQPVIDNTQSAGEKQQTAPTDRDPTPESGTGGASQAVTPGGTQDN